MATAKSWTASDIKMGTMRLNALNGDLSLIQGYSFVDSAGDQLEDLPKGSVMETVTFTTLPIAIQTALTTLNAYMYSKALTKEGMED